MSKNPQPQLLSLLKTARAVPVDKSLEKKTHKLTLKTLLEIQQKVEQTETVSPSDDEDRSHKLPNAYLDQTLSELTEKVNGLQEKNLSEFPAFGFINIFVKSFFSYINESYKLPHRLECLIEQLQLPILRQSHIQPKLLLNGQHPAFLLLNELVDYAPFWKDESKIGYPTYTKLSHLLIFSEIKNQSLSDHFTHLLQQVKSIKNNQQKRALIFEKRLKETELGKAKITTADIVVGQITKQIEDLKELPKIVKDIIDQSWSKLLKLEFLRSDEKAFSEALMVLKTLIASLRPITNKESLDHLFEDLPKINQQLTAGFQKTALENDQAETLIAEIETMHIALISESKKTISESDNLESSVEKNTSSNEILRLKPSDIFGELPEQAIEIQSDETSEIIEPLIDRTPLDELFLHFEQDIKSLTIEFASEQKTKDIEPKISALIEGSKNNPWFWLVSQEDKTLHKLVLSIDHIGQHIFVNADGGKSLSLTTNELADHLKDQSITPVQKVDLYQEASETCLVQLKEYVAEVSQIQEAKKAKQLEENQQQVAAKHKTKTENKPSKPKPAQGSEPIEISESTEVSEIKESIEVEVQQPVISHFDVNLITVGTWVKININDRSRRCKLAARISSKNLFIFVDRQGKKICELNLVELTIKLEERDAEIINAELTNGRSLESIISTNRSMKS